MDVPQQRMGRCLCNHVPLTLKPSIKKPQPPQQQQQQHLVPQVQVFVASTVQQLPQEKQQGQQGQVTSDGPPLACRCVERDENNILTSGRNNWNNTIDVVTHSASSQDRHQAAPPYKLRRYGSQQSFRSATTLRSVTSISRAAGNLLLITLT